MFSFHHIPDRDVTSGIQSNKEPCSLQAPMFTLPAKTCQEQESVAHWQRRLLQRWGSRVLAVAAPCTIGQRTFSFVTGAIHAR